MKSSSRLTGRPGGLAMPVADGLSNVVTGMGTGQDRNTFNSWVGSSGYVLPISIAEIDAAYRTSGIIRKVHDIIPDEMTKAWRTWSAKSGVTDLIKAEEKRLKLRMQTLLASRRARIRGGAALVMGLPGAADTPAPPPASIGKGGLKYILALTRDQLTAGETIWDPGDPMFGQPSYFRLSGGSRYADIHPSRVVVFPGMPGTGLMVSASIEEFWGYPLMETINGALQNSALVQTAIAALVPEAKTDILGIPGLTDMVSTADGEARLQKRIQVAQLLKSMWHTLVTDAGDRGSGPDANGETWETRQITWAGLPEISRLMFQVLAGETDIPLTRLIGSPPQGMNATGEHDEENFLRMIKSRQETDLKPRLEQIDAYLLASAGADLSTTWDFNPLKTLGPIEQADVDNVRADTLAIIKGTGLVQTDALAQVAVAALNESPNFPGLAEAVEASTEDLPATVEAEQAADVAKAALAPPAPAAGAGGAARRVAKVAANDAVTYHPVTRAQVMDGAPRTLYVSRKVTNPQEVLNHFRGQGVELALEAAGDLHVTIVHSRTPVVWMQMPADWWAGDNGKLTVKPGGPREMELFGPPEDRDTLVLAFSQPDLAWRNSQLIKAGCSTDWPEYAPHISIAKVAADFDVTKVAAYTGRIVLGPEIWEEIRVKEPAGDIIPA